MNFKALIFGVSVLALSACGGGGNSSSGGTPTGSTNSAPVVSSANQDQAGQVGFSFTYDVLQGGTTFSDPDGNSLTYSVVITPSDAGLSANGTTVSGTPNQTGNITVKVTASDNALGVTDEFDIAVTARQAAVQAKFGGTIDLDNLMSYDSPAVPAYIRDANTVLNPVTDAGATLGRVIFYDRDLSVNGLVACATCHQQAQGFSAPDVTSQGVFGAFTGRSSMRLVNTLYGPEERFFWDERAENMEDQVTRPFKDHGEHGFSGQNGRQDFDDMIAIMQADTAYNELFRFVFLDETVTEERIQSALAQFVHSITSFDSKYDTGRAQAPNDNADFSNFTADENAGKRIFLTPPGGNNGGAGCAGCHGAPDFQIAENSGTNGVVGVAGDAAAFDFTNTRAPALRDVVKGDMTPNGRFMHDGSLATLMDVINHYDDIPVPAGEPERTQFLDSIDNRLIDVATPRRLNLSQTEKNQLEAFLQTLTGTDIYTNVKWSDPN